ncbi:hypothetical protein LTR02_000322 [Friedmanniomyces endolithicus]|nr:hypothetical protein LTR02_000322 [Friedmanniomyces endolithicus]
MEMRRERRRTDQNGIYTNLRPQARGGAIDASRLRDEVYDLRKRNPDKAYRHFKWTVLDRSETTTVTCMYYRLMKHFNSSTHIAAVGGKGVEPAGYVQLNILRLAATSASVLLIWLLWYTLEPRKTAYSCRMFKSCIGLGRSNSYGLSLPQQSQSDESLVTLRDGTLRYQRVTTNADPSLLILVLNKDSKSWSSDFRSTSRSFNDFLDLLASTGLDFSTVSLGVWTASAEQFRTMQMAVDRLPFAKAVIYHQEDTSQGAVYENRHNPQVQLSRRSGLVKLRNRLMLSALQDETHVLWLDADVVELSPGIVPTMLEQSASTANAGIITAMCHQNEMNNYDKNAWRLDLPELLGPVPDAEREAAVAKLVATRVFVPELVQGTNNSAIVPLDSVGGTVLLIRANLVRQGLTFPHYNIIGTTWGHTGWIGVETEGLCYAARELEGGGCYVLGGSHHARHTDWG